MSEADLVVLLEAKVSQFERQLRSATQIADRNFSRIEKRSKQSASVIEKQFASLGKGVALGLASAVSLRGAEQLLDTSTRITNALKVAGLEGQKLQAVYKSLFASAQRNAAPLESLVSLYGRVSQVQGELGASSDDLLKFTDGVGLALRVAGTDAQTASGALLQLGQAMGSGVVHAEEFNSVLEGAPTIAQAVANGLKEAGGSVAKLRQLVIDGKVSSSAFFNGFLAGTDSLSDRVAGSETTISGSFVRLQNVLIDTAGRFNATSGAGQRFASFLDTLGVKITDLVSSPGFDSALNQLGDAMQQTFANDLSDLQKVGELIDAVTAKFDRYGASISDAQIELDNSYQAMANLGTNTKGMFGDVDEAFQDLVQQLIDGRGTAEMAAEAIQALGDANPNFAKLQASIGATIQNFIALRDAANAAHAAVGKTDRVEAGASWQSFSATFAPPAKPVKPVTLADYPVVPGSGGGGRRAGGGGGSGGASEQHDAVKELITDLQDELRVIGMSDTAKRIDTELRKAGAAATDQQKQRIRDLVTEIDSQTAATDRLQGAMDGAKGMTKDFFGGLIGDLRQGTDFATALSNAFGRLADQLIDMALNAAIEGLFGSLMGGASGGGLLGGLFGFSKGGEVQAFADGGHVRGPGTSTSDSIPAMLSAGEFVVNARATGQHRQLLEAINTGQIGAFADGGSVGRVMAPIAMPANDNRHFANDNAVTYQVSAPITVNGSAGSPEQNQDLAERMGKELESRMKAIAAREIQAQRRPGNMLNTRSGN